MFPSSSSSKLRPNRHQYIPMTSIQTMDQPGLPRKSIDSDNIDEASVRDEACGSTTELYVPSSSDSTVDTVYERKAKVLNAAIQEIGMGWYQWQLFVVVGFGWANDNLFPIVTSLILPQVTREFKATHPPLLTLAQNLGLSAGASFWGFGADIFGRKIAFNLTLFITGFFGLLAPASGSFAAIETFAALWSFGVGGNLPVDSAVFLEFLPGSHQYLLTVLSFFWSVAQIVGTLVAWGLIGKYSCSEKLIDGKPIECPRKDNMGWRYFLVAMGSLAMVEFVIRMGFFKVYESPKYLMGKGLDKDAVWVVHEIARINGKTSSLTIADLQACEDGSPAQETNASAAIKRQLSTFDLSHLRALFATKKLAFSTSLTMLIWALIGLSYPLYNAFIPYLQASRGVQFGDGSTNRTYLYTLIIAISGLPGAVLGGYLVEIPTLGRKGTLAVSTIVTGGLLLGSTKSTTSLQLLCWNCAFNFSSNVMYAVLYAYTPEVFPTKDRGTGNALTATSGRIGGIIAPLVAMYADLQTSVPVYISGAMFVLSGLLSLLLPYETQGKASL